MANNANDLKEQYAAKLKEIEDLEEILFEFGLSWSAKQYISELKDACWKAGRLRLTLELSEKGESNANEIMVAVKDTLGDSVIDPHCGGSNVRCGSRGYSRPG